MKYVKTEKSFFFDRRVGDNIDDTLFVSHYHKLFEIYFIAEGSCRYFIDNKVYDLEAGDIILIPEEVIHSTAYRNKAHTRLLINCSRRFIPPEAEQLFASGRYLYRNPDIKAEIHDLLCRIEREYKNKDELTEEALRCHTYMLFFLLIRSREGRKTVEAGNECIEKAINYIHENFTSDIALPDVAKLCSLSSEHLSRTFKKETGIGFCEYINLLRLKKAEAMLRQTGAGLSVSEVAAACGFNDSNYFSIKFKNMYGMPPTKMKAKK